MREATGTLVALSLPRQVDALPLGKTFFQTQEDKGVCSDSNRTGRSGIRELTTCALITLLWTYHCDMDPKCEGS